LFVFVYIKKLFNNIFILYFYRSSSDSSSKEKSAIKSIKESGNDRELRKEEEITEVPSARPTEVITNEVTEEITDSTLATTAPMMTTEATSVESTTTEPTTTMKSLQPSAPNGE